MNKFKPNLSVHFVGVGGAGMSVLCKLLLLKNFNVSGSDASNSNTVLELIKGGLRFSLGHNANNVDGADVVVYSSAISNDNCEIIRARQLKKAVLKRSELLDLVLKSYKKSIGIAGTHGKTTSTSMLTEILYNNYKNATALIGGESVNLGSFVYSDINDVIISEVCEFNKSIKDITVDYPVCLNVDNDHLDCYGDVTFLRDEFFSYLDRGKIKFINADDSFLRKYNCKKVVTFGIENDCNYRALNVKKVGKFYKFDLYIDNVFAKEFELNVFGKHNVYNALSSIAVAHKLFKLNLEGIAVSIKNFKGVKRRYEKIPTKLNKNVYADYAHHPTEIKKSIETAKEVLNDDFITVFQPHTYSRTRLLFNDFITALKDCELILYKEYPARESYDQNASALSLSKRLNNSLYAEDFETLIKLIESSCKGNVLLLGAGDLYDKIKNTDN